MHARIAATLTLAALAACGTQSATDAGTDGGATDLGATDASPEDLGAPDAGCMDGGCTSMLAFAPSADAPRAMDHHVTFLVTTPAGTWLYVAGGNDYTRTFADVSRAEVHADGTLGAWEAGPSLPSPRAGMSVVVDGGHVIVSGGKNFANPIPDVLYATVQPDGTLDGWTATTSLPAGRFHHSTLAANGFLYVIGGLQATDAVAAVLRAPIHTDGTLGAWTNEMDLPSPRSHHATTLAGGFVFLTGGLDGNPAGVYTDHAEVLRAPLAADGTLGPWTMVGTLDGPRETHASFTHDGFLYVVGGLLVDTQTIRIDRAALAGDGTLDATWEHFTFLPEARSHVHQTPLAFDRYMYSVDGQLRDGTVTSHVFVGTFE